MKFIALLAFIIISTGCTTTFNNLIAHRNETITLQSNYHEPISGEDFITSLTRSGPAPFWVENHFETEIHVADFYEGSSASFSDDQQSGSTHSGVSSSIADLKKKLTYDLNEIVETVEKIEKIQKETDKNLDNTLDNKSETMDIRKRINQYGQPKRIVIVRSSYSPQADNSSTTVKEFFTGVFAFLGGVVTAGAF